MESARQKNRHHRLISATLGIKLNSLCIRFNFDTPTQMVLNYQLVIINIINIIIITFMHLSLCVASHASRKNLEIRTNNKYSRMNCLIGASKFDNKLIYLHDTSPSNSPTSTHTPLNAMTLFCTNLCLRVFLCVTG